MDIIKEVKEIKSLYDEITTSDLQGLTLVLAHKITGIKYGDRENFHELMRVDNAILEYIYDKSDLDDLRIDLKKYIRGE